VWVTVIVKLFEPVAPFAVAVTEAEYVPASPACGAMWTFPEAEPGGVDDCVSVAKLGSEADNVITSPSASVALTATSAVEPSATF